MKSSAVLRYLRIAPRKTRQVADLVRGKNVDKARALLRFTPNKSSRPILKLLNSAAAGAMQKFQAEASNLYIAKITVEEGPKFKRFRPRARGQAYEVQKKTSHITIVLDELKKGAAAPKAAPASLAKKESEAKEIKPEAPKPFVKPKEETPKPKASFIKAPRMFRRKSI
ncbi:MAG: 50S ribosomal protein L22 [Candidatus Wildermuthbacteria bacterium]|nr:50S ribosomal protein L22 [Candidatus Wildermuthbacteria bacterium]